MKIAISNIAWENSEDDAIANILQRHDIRGLEIAPTKIWKDPLNTSKNEIEMYKKYWKNKNVDIVAMQSLLYGHSELTIFETTEKRKLLLHYLQKIIHLASLLGVKAMVFGSPKNRIKGDMDNTIANEIAYEFFNAIGDLARKYDINFCIEANPKQYGTDFLNTTKEVIQFIKILNNPNINIHLDTGAMKMNEEDPEKTIMSARQFAHFHISEPNLAPVPHQVDHKTIAEILKKIKYENWVSIEMRGHSQNNNTQVDKTLGFVIKTYRDETK